MARVRSRVPYTFRHATWHVSDLAHTSVVVEYVFYISTWRRRSDVFTDYTTYTQSHKDLAAALTKAWVQARGFAVSLRHDISHAEELC